jgi:aspartate aminotransferase
VTAGAKPALTAIFLAILNAGDEVIIPKPAWVSYESEISMAGGKAIFVSTGNDFDLNVEEIERSLTNKTRAILLNSPNNPTGRVYSKKSLEQLAEIVRDKDVFIISDDIYSRLVYREISLPIDVGFSRDQLIIVNGFSKSQALTGWRIGYVVCSSELQSKLNALISHIFGNASVVAQHGAMSALTYHDKPIFLDDLKRKRELVRQLLGDVEGVSYVPPDGAFYFFLDLRQITNDSESFCERLLDRYGVVLVPGDAFYMPGFARLSFASSEETLREGIKGLKKMINEGIDQ